MAATSIARRGRGIGVQSVVAAWGHRDAARQRRWSAAGAAGDGDNDDDDGGACGYCGRRPGRERERGRERESGTAGSGGAHTLREATMVRAA